MKSIYFDKRKAVYYFLYSSVVLVTLFFIIGGCSKLKTEDGPHVGGMLRFKVAGVTSSTIVSNLRSSVGNRSFTPANSDSYLNEKTISVGNFDFDITSKQNHIGTVLEGSSVYPSLEGNRAANVPMGDDIRYRILVYTLADVLVASKEGTADEELYIDVSPGQRYKWVAYSYNTTNPIPAPDDPINPTIVTPTTTTLLYASDDETVQIDNPSTPIAILFQHQLTQLNVEIGMNQHETVRTITELDAQFADDVLMTRTFNLLSGDFSGVLTPVNGVVLDFVESTPGSARSYVAKSYYTADTSLTSYAVKITNLKVQYTATEEKDLTPDLPGVGVSKGIVTFVNYSGANKGDVLLGWLKLWFVLPKMTIMAYSNNAGYGYQMEAGRASRNFMLSPYNFGPTSDYVRIDEVEIQNNYFGISNIRTLLASPADYPDILFIANHYNYLNDADWDAVLRYLKAGGRVYYGHDEPTGELYANRGLTNILGQNVIMIEDPWEWYGVYKFTDTPEAAADTAVLNGPFGDVSSFYWGQDNIGTTYLTGYTGDNIIKYSTTSQNLKIRIPGEVAMFRHKNYDFFYVGDGGFISNNHADGSGGDHGIIPFRLKGGVNTDPSRYLPSDSVGYGARATSDSNTYFSPYNTGTGKYHTMNSVFFGNLMSWMLHRAAFEPVRRDGSLRYP